MDNLRADLAPTGTLRASINLGNPVLASGAPQDPSGVTVTLAREIAARLGVGVELVCVDAAKDSVEAITDGRADLGFLAVDPARALRFTAPYVVIEGVYVVTDDSTIEAAVAWLRALVAELVASGFVAAALQDAGQDPGLAVSGP